MLYAYVSRMSYNYSRQKTQKQICLQSQKGVEFVQAVCGQISLSFNTLRPAALFIYMMSATCVNT